MSIAELFRSSWPRTSRWPCRFCCQASLLVQPWLLLAMTVYAANLPLALFIQRPELTRLLRLSPDTSDEARQRWRNRARRQRYVSYAMASMMGLIAFLMSTKPDF